MQRLTPAEPYGEVLEASLNADGGAVAAGDVPGDVSGFECDPSVFG
jgi:hypothetical protein